MPVDTSAVPGLPGMQSGFSGFSAKWVIRIFSSTDITPNELASATGTSMLPTVKSAPVCTWCSSIAE